MQPFSKSSCKLGNMEIAYFTEGKGEPVLLVHGITTNSFIWKKMVPKLAQNYQVIAIDLPGCGASGKNIEASYSIKAHAHLIAEFLEYLNIPKVHFVGHDVGGGIAQIFAVNYPEKLFDVSLMNSVAYDFWPVQPIIAMRTPIIRQLAMATLDKGALRLIIKRGLYYKERCTQELFNDFWEPMKTKQGRKAFLHFAACLNNEDLLEITDELHRLEVPLMIMRGGADPYLSNAITDKLSANITGAKLVHIETGSHFMQIDEPDLLSEELIKFFTKKRHD